MCCSLCLQEVQDTVRWPWLWFDGRELFGKQWVSRNPPLLSYSICTSFSMKVMISFLQIQIPVSSLCNYALVQQSDMKELPYSPETASTLKSCFLYKLSIYSSEPECVSKSRYTDIIFPKLSSCTENILSLISGQNHVLLVNLHFDWLMYLSPLCSFFDSLQIAWVLIITVGTKYCINHFKKNQIYSTNG